MPNSARPFYPANYNKIIETDPQIVKIPLDNVGWGSRASIFKHLGSDPTSQNPSKPTAPEMAVKHSGNM